MIHFYSKHRFKTSLYNNYQYYCCLEIKAPNLKMISLENDGMLFIPSNAYKTVKDQKDECQYIRRQFKNNSRTNIQLLQMKTIDHRQARIDKNIFLQVLHQIFR